MAQMTRNGGITQTLAQFMSDLTYEDLPPDVLDRAKYLCLDFAGVTLNGSTTDSAKAVVKALEDVGRTGPSAIIGTDKRVLPEYAAMANGTAFHSIEMDDVNNEASLHPGDENSLYLVGDHRRHAHPRRRRLHPGPDR